MQKIERRLPSSLTSVFRVLRQTVKEFGDDECALRAAALAYHALLSFFPLLLFLIFLASLVISTGGTRAVLQEYVHRAFPQFANPATSLIDQTISAGASFGILGAGGLLWTASAMFTVLASTFSTIWRVEPRSIWRRRIMGLLVVIALAILFVFSIVLRTFSAFDIDYLPLDRQSINLAIDFGVTTILLWILYTWLPNRSIDWKASLSGSVVAAGLWQIAKAAFSFYLAFGIERFGAIYGSLGSVIILVLWVYLSSIILFLGAEFAAVLQSGSYNQK